MLEGKIIKSVSGFYYVETENGVIECKARGNLRKGDSEPLVGDFVTISTDSKRGTLENIRERRNSFIRPAVANIDAIVIVCANVIPVTDPFLIDRVTAIAAYRGVDCIICINKNDLEQRDSLSEIYRHCGYQTICTSATEGTGIEELRESICGKTVVLTGNSGVGKTSILNALAPDLSLKTDAVSDKLGRGKHTTRHIEMFALGNNTFIADTPGFSSFDTERMEMIRKEELQLVFPDFAAFRERCRFPDCAHRKEPGCEVRMAAEANIIEPTRYESYLRLYERAMQLNDWEIK